MATIGKIGVIPKDYNNAFPTQEASLRQHGYSMFPGTMRIIFPYKEFNNKYRTGLDPEAQYIKSMKDAVAQEAEKIRVSKLKEDLEKALGVDLSPSSSFWSTVGGYALRDGDNIFDCADAKVALTYAWLRVHPTIAPSLQAWERGEVLPETTFYVKDEVAESEILYRRVKRRNDCIIKFDSFSPEKKKKIMRVMGLPVDDNQKEEIVYNNFNKVMQDAEMTTGPYKGRSPIDLFLQFADLEDHIIEVRDLVEQAFSYNIYRIGKGAKVYEGEMVVFDSKDEMLKFYLIDENQTDLFELQHKLKVKKLGNA